MSNYLLDSDIMIWHLRGQKAVTEMLRGLQRFGVPACSALSVLEVQLGVKQGEEDKTDRFLRSLKIIDVNWVVANKAAQLIRENKIKGITFDLPDAIIAATCILHDLVLVTYNKRHYPMPQIKFHPLAKLTS
jgi:tRNA(fMet)-specific endonuclease VapC